MKTITYFESNNIVEIDGRRYYLQPIDHPKDLYKETELKTFEDCWNKVKPEYYIDDDNLICEYLDYPEKYRTETLNQLPTHKSAQQIQAAIKLFVVMHALQENWVPDTEREAYSIWYNNGILLISKDYCNSYNNPYIFKDQETAHKAIDIAGDIFLEYFGVKTI